MSKEKEKNLVLTERLEVAGHASAFFFDVSAVD
jgi:hypothetical protein